MLAGLAAIAARAALIAAVIVGIRMIGVAVAIGALVGASLGRGCKHAEGQRAERKSDGGGDEPLTHVISWVFRSWTLPAGMQAEGPAPAALHRAQPGRRSASQTRVPPRGPSLTRPIPWMLRARFPLALNWDRSSGGGCTGRRMWRELGRISSRDASASFAPRTGPHSFRYGAQAPLHEGSLPCNWPHALHENRRHHRCAST